MGILDLFCTCMYVCRDAETDRQIDNPAPPLPLFVRDGWAAIYSSLARSRTSFQDLGRWSSDNGPLEMATLMEQARLLSQRLLSVLVYFLPPPSSLLFSIPSTLPLPSSTSSALAVNILVLLLSPLVSTASDLAGSDPESAKGHLHGLKVSPRSSTLFLRDHHALESCLLFFSLQLLARPSSLTQIRLPLRQSSHSYLSIHRIPP
ncbi:hypothetical protein HDV63DRAFT_140010 [Trichoderma sp. SZMC 28014]